METFLIAGLGNPGKEYQFTRHNVGFMVIDRLNEQLSGKFKKGRGAYWYSKVRIENKAVLLIKPVTYMNLSGQGLRQAIDYFKIEEISNVLVVMDDFNLPFGSVRLRASGSAGGQKGLQSILDHLKTNAIARLRIGIGNQFKNASSFVLSSFDRKEQKLLPDIINWGSDAVESFVLNGIDKTMMSYNRNV